MAVVCEICGNELQSLSSLKNHQKKNKACLEKQGKKSSYVCKECGKELSSNESLKSHTSKCISKKKADTSDIVSHLQEKIKLLETLVENLTIEVKYLRSENEYIKGPSKDKIVISKQPIEPFNVENIKKRLPEDLLGELENGRSVIVSVLFETIKYGEQKNYIFSDSPIQPNYRFDENGKWVEDKGGEYFDKGLLVFASCIKETWDKMNARLLLAISRGDREEINKNQNARTKLWDTRAAYSEDLNHERWIKMKIGIINAIKLLQIEIASTTVD
jgi:hypothetical protein